MIEYLLAYLNYRKRDEVLEIRLLKERVDWYVEKTV